MGGAVPLRDLHTAHERNWPGRPAHRRRSDPPHPDRLRRRPRHRLRRPHLSAPSPRHPPDPLTLGGRHRRAPVDAAVPTPEDPVLPRRHQLDDRCGGPGHTCRNWAPEPTTRCRHCRSGASMRDMTDAEAPVTSRQPTPAGRQARQARQTRRSLSTASARRPRPSRSSSPPAGPLDRPSRPDCPPPRRTPPAVGPLCRTCSPASGWSCPRGCCGSVATTPTTGSARTRPSRI